MPTEKEPQINEKNAPINKEASKADPTTSSFWTNPENFAPKEKLLKEYGALEKLKKLTPGQKKRKEEVNIGLGLLYSLTSGFLVLNLSHSKYYNALGKMRVEIIKEYKCKTPSELMLVDRMVASYWRAMKQDMMFNRILEDEEGRSSFDQLRVNVIKELNKGMELADRQFNTNVILLKELKQPKLNVKVSADTAYIAQNQQVINKEGKIIKPR